MAHKAYIEKIHQEIEDSRKTRLWEDSIQMLGTISESIFSRSAHFILELLQNAEDAGKKSDTSVGEIEFQISSDRVKVTHNGSPFDNNDANAICGVRSNKKPEEGTLGYLGIGFKSVFKVSDSPEIHSGGFHFKFDKGAYKEPASEAWQIVPIWIDQLSESVDSGLTTFVLPFRSSALYERTLEELQKLDVHVFLFLKWLKKLLIVDEVKGKTTVIENLGERDRIISVRKDGLEQRFAVFRRNSLVPHEVANDPALEFYKRQKVKEREVVLAFSVDAAANLKQIEDASTLGSVSSFLPLLEERSGAKFLIQSDFLVQPGREAIQYELSWNRWLISEAVETAKEAITEFKKYPKWKTQFLSVFDFTQYWGQATFEKLFRPYLHEPLTSYLQSSESYPTADGDYVEPEHAVQPDDQLKGLLIDDDLPLLFSGRMDLRLGDPNLDTKTVPSNVRNLVNEVGIGQVARNKDLLEEKLKQKNHVRWFSRLYLAMNETGQYFRDERGRSSRGKYYSYEAPIYVLTDRDTIVSAKQVYLGPIPRDVSQLRRKFAEVDNLLNSHQLIHPKLQIPQLEKFFKEHTHVQPIDYDKICREVFLPKIGVSSPPPQIDDLIAYTRLVQKGPVVLENVWVATKTGNIKPSNQVFLAADYFPAENWEKHAKNCPQMDFLSSVYLHGASQRDVPSWKEFFKKVGVRDQADNPYVATFAMAFVEDRLSHELKGFVPKDRQKDGYDREARRMTDNSIVCLEIKGRKKEEPIELSGNEPIAAKQAKQKKQSFWLCIVPGIPENPELWVVDDPLSVGDYDVVTIDVSKWKSAGRRLA